MRPAEYWTLAQWVVDEALKLSSVSRVIMRMKRPESNFPTGNRIALTGGEQPNRSVLNARMNAKAQRRGPDRVKFDPNSPVYAATLFKTYFDDLVVTIQDAFRQAESVFSRTQTFSSITSPVQYPAAAKPMGSDALHPTSVSNAQSSNGTHTNYVQTHTLNYVGQGGTFPPAAMGDGTSGDSLL